MDTRDTLDGEGVVMSAPHVVPERGGGLVAIQNENHTPPRSVRVPDELWEAAKATASDRGEVLSEEINRFLAHYVQAGVGDEDRLTRILRRLGA